MSAGERAKKKKKKNEKRGVWRRKAYHTLRKDMRMGTRRMVLPHDSVSAIANRWTNVKKIAECTKNATRHPAGNRWCQLSSNRRHNVVMVVVVV
jgi:hypothetical protein